MTQITIQRSVGRNGVNLPADVATIGVALVSVGMQQGGILAVPLEIADLGTAIAMFQSFHGLMQNPDGRVDPGGNTLKKINDIVSTVDHPPVTTITISGFSQYKTHIVDLPFEEQLDFERLVHALVNSLLPGAKIRVAGVNVIGHADSDAQGPAFEMSVSEQRAQNTLAYLKERAAAVAAAKGVDPNQLQQVAWHTNAMGATHKVFPSPQNEDERLANRRVDLIFEFGAPLPPPTHTWREGAQNGLNALTAHPTPPGPTRRMTCVLNKLLNDPAAIDGWVNKQALWLIPGYAGMPDLTPDQWATAINALVSHIKADLGSASAYGAGVSSEQIYTNLYNLDNLIGISIDHIMTQSVGDSSTGLFYRALMAWIGTQMLNTHSVYSCYNGYSRLHHDE